ARRRDPAGERRETMKGTANARRGVALVALAAAIFVGTSAAVPATSGATSVGTLNLHGRLALVSHLTSCPPGTSPTFTMWRARTAKGLVPGLDGLQGSYTFLCREGPP